MTLAALRFNVSRTSKYSPFYLLYNRDPILPVDQLLQPRQRYHGEEYHKIALQEQHNTFLSVYKNLKKAKREQASYAGKTAKDIKFEIGDPVFYKNFRKRSKLDVNWKPFYRIMEKKSPLTYIIKNQLDNSTVKVHAEQIRLANINDWSIPKADNTGRPKRNATFVVTPEKSDTDDASEIPESVLPQVAKNVRKERSNSDSEDDIPLAELQKHLRQQQQISNNDNAQSNAHSEEMQSQTDSELSDSNSIQVNSNPQSQATYNAIQSDSMADDNDSDNEMFINSISTKKKSIVKPRYKVSGKVNTKLHSNNKRLKPIVEMFLQGLASMY
jgi:hypothetical protein